ncbi:ABC-2 family transporter protein [Cohnella sp. AR92]|uniref:ABC transporter permease n=1 Tax=Cohnella sp. AR92 TaxID=648716 RepID=UPI0013152A09|nr:ABC-2 family transporter protein [Cohnella sp. AR92]
MITYFMFSVKAFTNQLAYRAEVWLRLLGNFVTILIQVEIWKAVIGSGNVDGVTVEQMITYSVINTLLSALLLNGVSSKVDDSLKSGGIASELVRPLSYPLYLLFDGLGNSIYQLTFTVAPSFLIAWLFFGILPPSSAANFIAFLGALIIALIVSFLLGYFISLLAFWFMNHFALSWTLNGLITVFSGSFLPIWFFPHYWASLAKALPFQYMGYVPATIYLGKMTGTQMWQTLALGMGWIAALLVLVQWLWARAVRRLVIQGG